MPIKKQDNPDFPWFATAHNGDVKPCKTRAEARDWIKEVKERPPHSCEEPNYIPCSHASTKKYTTEELLKEQSISDPIERFGKNIGNKVEAVMKEHTDAAFAASDAVHNTPVPIHTQIILALEQGVFNHSNIKAKNPNTGKVVKMTLGSGNRAFVSGMKVDNIQRAMALFSVQARNIGASVLEWVAR